MVPQALCISSCSVGTFGFNSTAHNIKNGDQSISIMIVWDGFQTDAHRMTLSVNQNIAVNLVANQRASLKHQFENLPE